MEKVRKGRLAQSSAFQTEREISNGSRLISKNRLYLIFITFQ